MNENWILEEKGFCEEHCESNGSRMLIGNGYMGYRGTLEEFRLDRLVACNMAGLYDRKGTAWRESVNAPNFFYTTLFVNDCELNVLKSKIVSHCQRLNIRHGIHTRVTVYELNGVKFTFKVERFLSMNKENIGALKCSLTADNDATITIKTGIDTSIWDINGKHLNMQLFNKKNNILKISYLTEENRIPLNTYEYIEDFEFVGLKDGIFLNEKTVELKADKEFSFTKICGVYWGERVGNSDTIFLNTTKNYITLLNEHKVEWEKLWGNADIVIEGDEKAQFALRYSMYHLCSIVPRNSDKCGIPARGLSGQVYKGAAFWDTEMFMSPFFNFTNPQLAKNLVNYRINTIEGAYRKAKEYGCEGAFYAWESQETGDDACTDFNITDVFTKRPLRTYFREGQIHISADMAYALWEYCRITGDYDILVNGGLELAYQCVRFFYTYAYYKPVKKYYELLNVVGPDEYHERVNNNAFTNYLVKKSADFLIFALDLVEKKYPNFYDDFKKSHEFEWIYVFANELYIPKVNNDGVIEQFDGYFKLEDISIDELMKRVINPDEYWGGHGLASTTKVIKQADVVMLLNVLRSEFSYDIKKANWEYYEPYCQHASSLSACAYAIVAAEIGKINWAYQYFMKTAEVDLLHSAKPYIPGSFYNGGTHPAANGGAWNTAIFGFAGVSYTNDTLDISPRLPENWKRMKFKLFWKGVCLTVEIKDGKTTIAADSNTNKVNVTVDGKGYSFNR